MVSFGDSSSKKPRRNTFSGGLSKPSKKNTEGDNPAQKILSEAQLVRLKQHRYNSVCTSLLDPYLQPYWSWLVQQLPIWMAPNLITVLGLLINVVTSLILIFYSPDCNQRVPAWGLVLCAIGLFTYQSLDAIDGKQARRTKSSSPLGELFDHGCDSISTVFVSLGLCAACRLGAAPRLMFVQSLMAVSLFYCAHWQTYVTGLLKFGYFDVTEAQMVIIFIHLLTAALGGDFWVEVRIPIVDLPLFTIYVVIGLAGAIYTLCSGFKTILYQGAGKNGSSIAGTSVLSPFIPFALVVIPAILIAAKSKEDIFGTSPAVYILTFGLLAAKVTNRLVVAHMTKSEIDFFDIALIGPMMLFLNQYFDIIITEKYLLYASLAFVTFELCRYSRKVCLEICDSLNIHLFKIDVPKVETESTQEEGSLPKLYSNMGGRSGDTTGHLANVGSQARTKATK